MVGLAILFQFKLSQYTFVKTFILNKNVFEKSSN